MAQDRHRPRRLRRVPVWGDEGHRGPADQLLDRTPFYRDMAALEGRVREKTGIRDRFRMTVAQMIATAGKGIS